MEQEVQNQVASLEIETVDKDDTISGVASPTLSIEVQPEPAPEGVPTTTTTPPAVKPPKAPTKKQQATEIFQRHLVKYLAGEYDSKKDFRHEVLVGMEVELGVTRPSASTMYNTAKQEAEAAGTVVLGRDPRKEKAPSTGVKGRPKGSKNKEKVEGETKTEAVATEAVATEAAPEGEAPVETSTSTEIEPVENTSVESTETADV
jgi:hypothetical protein